jgi:hypothetical protein
VNSAGLLAASEARGDQADGFMPERPFSGVLVEYNRNQPEVKRETNLLLSEKGMRSEIHANQFNHVKIAFIRNYQTGQDWLADPTRRTYSELPKGKPTEHAEDIKNDESHFFGVLANRPCAGVNGDKQSTRSVGESELTVWRCSDERGHTYLQHFSTLLGVVVRQESQDGWISELRDITLVDDSHDYFKPSNGYREVTLSEFIMGKVELPGYVE